MMEDLEQANVISGQMEEIEQILFIERSNQIALTYRIDCLFRNIIMTNLSYLCLDDSVLKREFDLDLKLAEKVRDYNYELLAVSNRRIYDYTKTLEELKKSYYDILELKESIEV